MEILEENGLGMGDYGDYGILLGGKLIYVQHSFVIKENHWRAAAFIPDSENNPAWETHTTDSIK